MNPYIRTEKVFNSIVNALKLIVHLIFALVIFALAIAMLGLTVYYVYIGLTTGSWSVANGDAASQGGIYLIAMIGVAAPYALYKAVRASGNGFKSWLRLRAVDWQREQTSKIE